MRIILQGTQKCRFCGKEFEWVEVESSKRSRLEEVSAASVEVVPPGREIACRSGVNGEYLEVYCSHCGAKNKSEFN